MESTVKMMLSTLDCNGVTISVSEIGTNGLVGSAISTLDKNGYVYIGGMNFIKKESVNQFSISKETELIPLSYDIATYSDKFFGSGFTVGIVSDWKKEKSSAYFVYHNKGGISYMHKEFLLDAKGKSDSIYKLICGVCEKIVSIVEEGK